MPTVPAALQTKLNSGFTKLARCWKITRLDGTIMTYTNHDQDIVVDNITYRANPGMTPTALQRAKDFIIDNMEMTAIIRNDYTTDFTIADSEAGLYDGAEIKIFLVDWETPSDGIIVLERGILGNVTIINGLTLQAELRGLVSRLAQTTTTKSYQIADRAKAFSPEHGIDAANWETDAIVNSITDNRQFVLKPGLKIVIGDDEDFGDVGTLADLTSTGGTGLHIADPELSGIWESDPLDLSLFAGETIHSIGTVSWAATIPTGCTILIETSFDGGSSYSTQTNGGIIDNIPTSDTYSSLSMTVRVTLTRNSTSLDPYVDTITIMLSAEDLDFDTDNYYKNGEIIWTTGNNYRPSITSQRFYRKEIDRNISSEFFLPQGMTFDVAVGNNCIVQAGYDRSLEQAINKFDNVVNYRGEPWIPNQKDLGQKT